MAYLHFCLRPAMNPTLCWVPLRGKQQAHSESPLIRASHDGSLLGDLILISGFRSVVELGAKFKHGYMRAPIIFEGLGSDYKHRTTLIWSLHQKYAIFKGRPNMKQSQNFCFSVYPRCGPNYFPRATSLNLQHVRLSPQKLAIPQKKALAIR